MKQNIEEFKKSPHIGNSDSRSVDKIISLAESNGLLSFLEKMSYGEMKGLKAYEKCNAAMQKSFDKTIDKFEAEFSTRYAQNALNLLVDSFYAGKHGVKALEDAKAELKTGIGRD